MNVTCIRCWDGLVRLDLDGSGVMTCAECAEEFSCDDVRKVIDGAAGWAKLLPWLDAYPKAAADPAK